MTDPEKLQQLFTAALRSQPRDYEAHPVKHRAVPTPAVAVPVTPVPMGVVKPAAENAPAVEEPRLAKCDAPGKPAGRCGTRRLGVLVAALVFLGAVGAGLSWFVAQPGRLDTLRAALREVWSTGEPEAQVPPAKRD